MSGGKNEPALGPIVAGAILAGQVAAIGGLWAVYPAGGVVAAVGAVLIGAALRQGRPGAATTGAAGSPGRRPRAGLQPRPPGPAGLQPRPPGGPDIARDPCSAR